MQKILIGIFLIVILAPVGAALIYWEVEPGRLLKLVREAQRFADDHFVLALVLYGLWSLILQLTVLPVGTLTIFIATFLIGPVAAISIYLLAMLIAIWPIYWIVDTLIRSRGALVDRILARIHPALAELPTELRREGIISSIILRLTPMFPSGIATASAALLGIRLHHYVLGTLFSAWIRPILIATSALGVETIAEAIYVPRSTSTNQWLALVALLGIAFIGLAIRIWIRRRKKSS